MIDSQIVSSHVEEKRGIRTRWSLLALAMGTFCFGMTEYVMMAILPDMARDFHVSIPQAGHLISSYALGVCVGAPLLAMLGRTWPLRRILLVLMAIVIVAGIGMVFSASYGVMLVARFFAGMPHGAFFGVGSLVASRISKPEKVTLSIAFMCSGMTVANLIGIPFGTWITALFSWRMVFAISTLCAILTLIAIIAWVPKLPPLPNVGVKGTFRFLTHLAPWLIVIATMMGNGGIFAYYSYISPLLTQVSGVPEMMMTLMMVLAGAGMVAGNLCGGKLSDKVGAGHAGFYLVILMAVSLLLMYIFAPIPWIAVPLMMLTTFGLFGVSSPQQLLLLKYSEGGELMGGAMVQVAFNFGNAIGAFAGGIPISLGMPIQTTALVGLFFVLIAVAGYIWFCHRYEKR